MTHHTEDRPRWMSLARRVGAPLLAAAALATAAAPRPACAGPASPPPTPPTPLTSPTPHGDAAEARGEDPIWLRVIEEEDGEVIKLQLVSREYRAPGADGPSVFLTGAVHIADASFYAELQEFLDAKDVVLFEGVKPPGAGRLDHNELRGDDEWLAKATTRRIRFVATFAERHMRTHNAYPSSLGELIDAADGRVAKLLAGSTNDAWGNPLLYTLAPPAPAEDDAAALPTRHGHAGSRGFEITSLGADGKPGGDGVDADITFAEQPAIKREELVEGEGIQRQLASALRLEFQLDAMDDTKPNWRNSDLSVDQVMDRLEAGGADAGQLFSMIGGGGIMDAAIGLLAKAVGMSKTLSTMLKIAMVDMLSQADQLIAGAGGDIGKMMEVIIDDRNHVVVDDLAKILRDEPDVKSIGIIYGAGHLADLHERLRDELNLAPVGETWFTAITVQVADAGMSPAEASSMRRMLKSQIKRQMKSMQGRP